MVRTLLLCLLYLIVVPMIQIGSDVSEIKEVLVGNCVCWDNLAQPDCGGVVGGCTQCEVETGEGNHESDCFGHLWNFQYAAYRICYRHVESLVSSLDCGLYSTRNRRKTTRSPILRVKFELRTITYRVTRRMTQFVLLVTM
jgi:hypothetical protein